MAALWAELSEPDDIPDRRDSARRTLRLVARTAHAPIADEVLILDLSTTGLMFETNAMLSIGERIEVELPEAGAIPARVIWQREAYFGCEFLTRAPVKAISAALLRSPPRPHAVHSWTFDSSWRDAFLTPAKRKQAASRNNLAQFVLTVLLMGGGIFLLALIILLMSNK